MFFYAQHLLGTGHLKRSLLLTEAMRRSGYDAYLVSGGLPTPDLPLDDHVIQLPAARALDQSFRELVDERGGPIDNAWKVERRRQLLHQYQRLRPDIVVIESYPFGRRQFRFELIPLLDIIQAVTPKPLVVCSVRDVIQARPTKRIRETVEILRHYFDLVVIHGDPDFIRFEESFPAMDEIRHLAHYTGYVAAPAYHGGDAGTGEVVVSAGGGAVSAALLETAVKARRLSRTKSSNWRILVGQNATAGEFSRLRGEVEEGLMVERNRPDFPVLLRNCLLSVSQAGYNTVVDLLRAGARSVVVPFEGDGETEQAHRARRLQQWGMAQLVHEHDLSPASLAQAIDRAADSKPTRCSLDLEGADKTARLLTKFWQQMRQAR